MTFPKAEPVREAARITPDRSPADRDRCPYLAPVPHRGKRNEPAFVVETARRLAELRGVLDRRDCERHDGEFRALVQTYRVPANILMSRPAPCATLNDAATEEGSSSPSPHVAVIIARFASSCGSPARDAAFNQRVKRRRWIIASSRFMWAPFRKLPNHRCG